MQQEKIRSYLFKNMTNDSFIEKMQESMLPVRTLMTYYKCAMLEIETKFNVLDEEFSLHYDRNPIETIKTRLKSIDGIAKKLNKLNLPFTEEAIEQNIYDVAGIRVICAFLDDIYKLADYLLQQDDIRLIERKDYIKSPKPSGYRSLHLIVEVPIFLADVKRCMKVEVQLRTIAMDFWASLEHKLRYKKNIPENETTEISKDLLKCAEQIAALDKRMEAIKNRLMEHE